MPDFSISQTKLMALAIAAALTLSACATTGTTNASQPMPVARTPEQLKGDCWMKYENDPKMSIDKRADLVDKCIAERGAPRAPVN